jgi:gamma-glutamyltranspeptidase
VENGQHTLDLLAARLEEPRQLQISAINVDGGVRSPVGLSSSSEQTGRPCWSEGATLSIPQPEATETGRDILAAEGNAIDAALATALVQGVVDPLMCGITGFGSLAVYLPSKRIHTYYDFHSPAPGAVPAAMK